MPREVTFKAGVVGGETRMLTVKLSDEDVTPWGLDAELTYVGADTPRLEAPLKVAGVAQYTWDVQRPNMAYCKLVRCFRAHAQVKAVDISAAERMRGVLGVDVLTPPGRKATFSGKGIVAICAETPEILEDAVAAVKVEYEELPASITTEQGMAPDAPRVSGRRPNFIPPERATGRGKPRVVGNPDEALAGSHKQVSAQFRTQTQNHIALEPHGSVVEFQPDGSVTVWASTQGTGASRRGFARALGLKEAQVHVIAEHIGGGFGAKLGGIDAWDVAGAKFAQRLGRPVKTMLDRREEHLVAGCRPNSIQTLALGCDADGRITALTATTYGTAGNGGGGAGATNDAVYNFPNKRIIEATVSTHTGRARAFRAPGRPQGLFALEGIVDMLAHEAGTDPLDFRLKNDPHPVRQVQWRAGAEQIDWKRWRRTAPGAGKGPVKRGVGCAAGLWYTPGRGNWMVELDLTQAGEVIVKNAVQDIGTGTRTLLAVIVAEELGIEPARITVKIGDTNYRPGPPSGGSQTAPSIGPAARIAGARARAGLVSVLAQDWECKPEEIAHAKGQFTGPGGRKASFAQVCARLGRDGLSVSGSRQPNFEGFHGQTAGCQFAQVAVDIETGVVKVERIVAVHSAGRVVNTLLARSQIIGGVIQGVSYALYENRRLDGNLGDQVNPTMDTYRILGIADTPVIDCLITQVDSGFNNIGMMGIGEPVTVPTAGAVANAVFHATGARVTQIPITPAVMLAALEDLR